MTTISFLTDAQQQQVEAAVASAEKRTAGEIVVMIASAAYHYPLSEVIAATAFALPLSVLLTYALGSVLWLGTRDMWLFMGLFAVLFLVCRLAVRRLPAVKRRFISRQEIDEEVEEAAVTAFYRKGLHHTRDETGVLLFIAVFEKKVWLLADRGINAKVGQDSWKEITRKLTTGIQENRAADAICTAVAEIGDLLADHFPIKPDDTNELKNLIIE